MNPTISLLFRAPSYLVAGSSFLFYFLPTVQSAKSRGRKNSFGYSFFLLCSVILGRSRSFDSIVDRSNSFLAMNGREEKVLNDRVLYGTKIGI